MDKRIALLGVNVSKSPSPAMHNAAFAHLKLPYTYSAISVSEEDFPSVFGELREGECRGLNITIPYKERAAEMVGELSPRGKKLGAINTIVFGEPVFGENTDVDGLVLSLRETGRTASRGEKAFVFGAGGAAKATIEALSLFGIRRFTVTTRSRERLSRFEQWFQNRYPRHALDAFPFSRNPDATKEFFIGQLSESSLFVNAAPASACDEVPFFSAIEFPPDLLAVEWVYTPRITPWLKKAKEFVQGYKILLYQGMQAFQLWTGTEAPQKVMEKALLEELC